MTAGGALLRFEGVAKTYAALPHPVTALRCDETTRVLVSEMGARGEGHIAYLCEITPPDVSVVLPVFNEKGHLREEIDRISVALDASEFSYEIIVVDDGSTDGSGEALYAGGLLQLDVDIPPQANCGPISLGMKILWCIPANSPDEFWAGLETLDMSPDSQAALQALLAYLGETA